MAGVAQTKRRRRLLVAAAGAGSLVALTLVSVPAADALGSGAACENRNNNTYAKLLECVTLDGVMEHLEAFQAIADANDDEFFPGSRRAGTAGYDTSVDYVAGLLENAGYQVTLHQFEFVFQFPALLRQLTPVDEEYPSGPFTGSGGGDVTGNVIPVDLALADPITSTSGCEAADFASADWSGDSDIALIQRGGCLFADKASNAQTAGAEAVIIFNQGDAPTNDRQGLIVGTLGDFVADIPVVGASFAQGQALAQAGSTAHVQTRQPETRTSVNVIAEKPGKNPNNVVMAGAHLDAEVAGINDNGSGAAALLETALMMANLKPQNTLRFAWWGAEEAGLVGSTAYVESLSPAERSKIALYMNYDMVGSPNYIFMVYDADESTFPAPVPVPPGSAAIEDVYEAYYTMIGEPYDDTEFSGRSDYEAFILNGIPSSGLFTGAEEIKTAQQQAIWGGAVDEQFDQCYHLACDDIDNIDAHALEVNSDLIAFAMLTFAYSTESVNGVPGAKVPGPPVHLPPPAGPQGTFVESDGGHGPGPLAS
ncbi:MAG: M28 family peptidase [Micromonosporaceae bacterium]|nr:M28 family peptidase [Micromonosporaceae bacterium]